MRPSSPIFGNSSFGKCCASSHSMTCGRISASANSRTIRLTCSCSSVKSKSIGIATNIAEGVTDPYEDPPGPDPISRREPDAPQQDLEPRVGADRIDLRQYFEVGQIIRAFLIRLVEPGESQL